MNSIDWISVKFTGITTGGAVVLQAVIPNNPLSTIISTLTAVSLILAVSYNAYKFGKELLSDFGSKIKKKNTKK